MADLGVLDDLWELWELDEGELCKGKVGLGVAGEKMTIGYSNHLSS